MSVDEVDPIICEECNDAPATTERLFNGVTRCALCDGCAAYWDENALDTPAGWQERARAPFLRRLDTRRAAGDD